MSSNFSSFHALHHTGHLFLLPNAWDARSAALFEQQQFPAIATSSAAVATSLGYADGEGMPFDDYFFVIRRILSAVKIPLSVDLEMGYGKTPQAIGDRVLQLWEAGVAGINIEDSLIDDGTRVLGDAAAFADTLAFIKRNLAAKQARLFINVRCDTYLLNVAGKQAATQQRLALYEAAGADGIFLPCITDPADIAAAVESTRLPVNVMCVPGLPDFSQLQELGVKRVSMGPFLFNNVYDRIGALAANIQTTQSFAPVFS